MSQMVKDLIMKIDDAEYRVMIDLEDRALYDDDKEAEKKLMEMCHSHGFSLIDFVRWCED